jgi:hypothetical protein
MIRKGGATTMNLEQFRATRTICNDLGTVLNDSRWNDNGEAGTGFLYEGMLYIENVTAAWPETCQKQGKYYLILERDEYISDDLADLEAKLYRFGISSGAVDPEPGFDPDASETW